MLAAMVGAAPGQCRCDKPRWSHPGQIWLGRTDRNAAVLTASGQGGAPQRNLAKAGPPQHVNDGGQLHILCICFFATLKGGAILLKNLLESQICNRNVFCLKYVKQSTFRKLSKLSPHVGTHMQPACGAHAGLIFATRKF